MRRLTKPFAAILSGAVFLFIITAATPLKADEWDLATIFSVNQPFEVPGKVLEPDTRYLMKLLDSPANRGIVQVFNEDRTHLITTFLAVPKIRQEATDKTTFEFMEVPAGNPLPIRAWYYPGRKTGLEFMYGKKQLEKIAGYTKASSVSLVESAQATQIAPAVQSEPTEGADIEYLALSLPTVQNPDISKTDTDIAQSQVTESDSFKVTESDVERSKPTEPEPNVSTAPSSETPSELPRTADAVALFGLAGAVSVGLGLGIRSLKR